MYLSKLEKKFMNCCLTKQFSKYAIAKHVTKLVFRYKENYYSIQKLPLLTNTTYIPPNITDVHM